MEHLDLIAFLGTFMFSFVGAFYFDARKAEAQRCHCARNSAGWSHPEGFEL
jgi:hypothetical protein